MNLNWLLVGGLLASVAACAWLYSENHSLENQLAAARADRDRATPQAAVQPPPTPTPSSAGNSGASADKPTPEPSRLSARAERPSLAEEAPEETRQERRKRRMAEVTALFGRLDGETEDEYRERMVPFIETALAIPRSRVEDARRAAEQAAGVTEEQRGQLDAAFDDAFAEALALTNRAVESGDLSPYQRNWSGAMNFAGGLGAVLEGTETRIGEILSADQQRIIYDQGFEWGEYLGVSVPWEELRPPPAPGDGRSP